MVARTTVAVRRLLLILLSDQAACLEVSLCDAGGFS